jgi:hypothetical protein
VRRVPDKDQTKIFEQQGNVRLAESEFEYCGAATTAAPKKIFIGRNSSQVVAVLLFLAARP